VKETLVTLAIILYAYPYFAGPLAPCVLVRRGGGWFCI